VAELLEDNNIDNNIGTSGTAGTGKRSTAFFNAGGGLKLSTGSMPSDRLDLVAANRHYNQNKVSFKGSQPILAAELAPRRRFSGLYGADGSGNVEVKRVALDNDYKVLREVRKWW
jgi:hypothetical protein